MDNFEVGIDDLDEDHRYMCRQINTICEAIAAGDMEVVPRELSAFVDFAAAHIERETRVLTALDPRRVFAADTAVDRLKPISDLAVRFNRGEQDVAEVPTELVDWFCRQTIDHDAVIRSRFHRRSSTACLR
jgi:hemerythrin